MEPTGPQVIKFASKESIADLKKEGVIDYSDNAMFEWVEGLPRPKDAASFQKEQISQLTFAALSLPYRGIWDSQQQKYVMDDPMYQGATYAEVMQMKLVKKAAENGDMSAIKEVLDRTLGKPKQAIESVSMRMSYAEFLEQSAKEEAQAETPNKITYGDFLDISASEVTPTMRELDTLLEGI